MDEDEIGAAYVRWLVRKGHLGRICYELGEQRSGLEGYYCVIIAEFPKGIFYLYPAARLIKDKGGVFGKIGEMYPF